MEQEIVQVSGEVGDIRMMRSPEIVIKEAEMVAMVFRKKADQLQLYKKIGESKHLLIEGWQMLAAVYGISARARETRYLEFGQVNGYECSAEAYHIGTGRVVSTADAMCLSDEDKWSARPKYEWQNGQRVQIGSVAVPLQQLRSMAQTRAMSKALSNLFKWIAKMAGYATTPAEEMTGDEGAADSRSSAPTATSAPKRKSESAGEGQPTNGDHGDKISDKQKSRFWAIAFKNGGKDRAISIVKHFGFATVDDIAKEKYEAICAEIERPAEKSDAAE